MLKNLPCRLIRFCEAGVPKCQETVPAWENLANDLRENAHILCADVDVVESDKVARRFGVDNAKLPFYILLRNQKMYEAPSAVTAIYALMYDWAVDGWKDGQGVAVPPEMSGDTFLWLTDGVQHVRSWFIAQLSKAQSRVSCADMGCDCFWRFPFDIVFQHTMQRSYIMM